ncbi:MAG: alpha-glucan family phosphorylase [Gaiellaceae bacterium]
MSASGSTWDDATRAGADDIASRVADLAAALPDGLKPLAAVAYNYGWSWVPGGEAVFRDINPHRWELAGRNPVKFLSGLWPSTRERADRDEDIRRRVRDLADTLRADLARAPIAPAGVPVPIAYMCAEFGVHASLETYSGGLGVLAGDMLKQASDSALPLVGVGLFYRKGYFHQRLDLEGRQLEHWNAIDPKTLPMARVSVDGEPLKLAVEVFGRPIRFQVWRVDVGRVPLFLLDAELPDNDRVQRWTTARLYEGNRGIRLAQYALLGIGGIRALQAMGIDPGVVHLNEGHPVLAALELAAKDVERGTPTGDALARARERFVFTTHTPVAAGNETYSAEELLAAFSDVRSRLDLDEPSFLGLFRTHPEDAEPGGLTQAALRLSRRRNAVSRLHGEVAREMWQPLFGDEPATPIDHVTNGIHVPTFLSPPFRALYDRHLGEDWALRVTDPATWEPVREIPDAELWAARAEARAELVRWARDKSELDLLLRGEQMEYVSAAAEALDPHALTLGFARRLATYKRVYLLASDPARTLRLLDGDPPVQLLVAGKAHPRDDGGKEALRSLFALRHSPEVGASRAVVLEDYDLNVGQQLVAGCDVWINLPRRPLEASGTSGMKTTFNGALQLSVLDGWWAEAWNGRNGWAIESAGAASPEEQDARDAEDFYGLLEREVIPLFYERDEAGIPHGWCAMVKEAIATCAPAFSAARMLDEYIREIYAQPLAVAR